jgi:hypothetical protein
MNTLKFFKTHPTTPKNGFFLVGWTTRKISLNLLLKISDLTTKILDPPSLSLSLSLTHLTLIMRVGVGVVRWVWRQWNG